MMDGETRISSTNHRMMRRMLRDHNFRGNPVEKTFSLWPSVRAGDECLALLVAVFPDGEAGLALEEFREVVDVAKPKPVGGFGGAQVGGA